MIARKCPLYSEREGCSYWSLHGGMDETVGWQLVYLRVRPDSAPEPPESLNESHALLELLFS